MIDHPVNLEFIVLLEALDQLLGVVTKDADGLELFVHKLAEDVLQHHNLLLDEVYLLIGNLMPSLCFFLACESRTDSAWYYSVRAR